MPDRPRTPPSDAILGADSSSARLVTIVIAVAFCGLLVFDVATPLGYADWIFYVGPVGLAALLRQPSAPIAAAAIATLLTAIGYLLSPIPVSIQLDGSDAAHAWINRSFGVGAYWTLAVIGRAYAIQRRDLRRTGWQRGVQSTLSERLRGELSVAQICDATLTLLVERLAAVVGVAYAFVDAATLARVAAHGLGDVAAGARIAIGENLVGRVAADGTLRVIDDAPPGYLMVESGTGRHLPTTVVIVPAVIDDEVHAVLELGFFRSLDADQLAALALVGEATAAAIRSAAYRVRIEGLLGQTRQQAEELQAQQEELRVTNEELEEQATALREAQGELERRQGRLQATNADLEAQRLAALAAREQLRQRAAELTTSNRYKSEFLANMSHELRTPLNSALIMARLLADNRGGNLTPEQVKFAETIHAAGTDLLDLINDILDLSKIEAGKVDLRLTNVSLVGVVEGMRRMFAQLAEQRGLQFAITVEPEAARDLSTDATRLAQILKNLLSNAFKFTERGSVTLEVRRVGDGFAFSVHDTGIGIAADRLDSIFDHFTQADGSISRRFGGTGLGLAISRQLALMLGGRLDVSSRENVGSTFVLWIPDMPPSGPDVVATPALVGAPAHAPSTEPTQPIAIPVGAPDGVHRVLVVEDDPDFAVAVQALARDRGFVGMIAGTAAEAIELARTHRFEGVLLDLRLPDASGLTVLEQLKRDPLTRHVPVHVLTGFDDGPRAIDLGAVGYARKPVEHDQIARVLDRLAVVGRTRRVLVVEDEAPQLQAIVELLRGDGVEIVGVGTLAEAEQRLRTDEFECVVLDLVLPDGSGFELLERLSADENRVLPPIVVHTARDLSHAEEQSLRRCSSAVIVKGPQSAARLLDEVTLFLHSVESELRTEQRQVLQKVRDRERVFEDRRILVVEDDVRNVFALTSVLEPRGARVSIARNGREALAILAQQPELDLVLMDVMMPELDGLEATRRIRREPRWARLPIIMLTAKAMPDDRDRCLDAGANDYLAKPVEVDKLLGLLRVWLPR